MLFKKIFFDLDNTLFSHEYAFEKAIQDCFNDVIEDWEEQGLEIPHISTEDWFDVFKYHSDLYWHAYEQKEYSEQEYRRKRYMQTMKHFGLPCAAEEADEFHQKYYEKAINYVSPFPGLYTLLQFLKDKAVEIGVITNGKHKVQWGKYSKLKLHRYIERENFLVSEDVGIEKPDPRIFNLALGTTDKKAALFVGDTWEHDIVGALEAGWQAIYLNTYSRPRAHTEHHPLAELTALHQLLPFLNNAMQQGGE